MKIQAYRVELYEYQIEQIEPMLQKVHEAAEAGEPGFLAAQIIQSEMYVFFIDHDRALKFQELMGQEIGRTGCGYSSDGRPIEAKCPVCDATRGHKFNCSLNQP